MPRPGTDVLISDGAGPAQAALDTGTAFMIGASERGPNDKALRVSSIADYGVKFGARVGGSLLYDGVSAYFNEGGGSLYVSRVVGAGATKASVAFGVLAASAASVGVWGNSLTIETIAPTTFADALQAQHSERQGVEDGEPSPRAGTSAVLVVKLSGKIVDRSPAMSTTDEAIAWSASRDYVRLTGPAGGVLPAAGTVATLVGGTAGSAAVAADYDTALARFDHAFGPGQVLAPGLTTATTQKSVLAHCNTNKRCALLDLPDSSDPLVLYAAIDALATTPGIRMASAWAPWATYPADTPPAIVTVPYSAVEAGIISRNDRAGNPNVPAAGANGVAALAIGLSQTYTDAQREALNNYGVDLAKIVYGDVRSYGYRTAAGPTDVNWLWFGNSRTVMAIGFECEAVGESYVLQQIDGRGQIFSRLNKDLAGVCAKYYDMGALYGESPEEAFDIDTGPGVNSIDTIKRGEIHAIVKVKTSPAAEWVVIEIVKVPVDRAVAA